MRGWVGLTVVEPFVESENYSHCQNQARYPYVKKKLSGLKIESCSQVMVIIQLKCKLSSWDPINYSTSSDSGLEIV
jgi:hypothetical protein